jgi:choline kinase
MQSLTRRVTKLKSNAFEAIILAAGQGKRMPSNFRSEPKGLLNLGDTTPIQLAINTLIRANIKKITIVTGYLSGMYRSKFKDWPEVKLIENPHYESCGSFSSLAACKEEIENNVLILESDIIFHPKIVSDVLSTTSPNLVVVTSKSNSGDEVWARLAKGRLHSLSKDVSSSDVLGEYVGISRFSAEAFQQIMSANLCNLQNNSPRKCISQEYEIGINELALEGKVEIFWKEDLIWTEIDTEEDFLKAKTKVFPRLRPIYEDLGIPL